VSGAQALGALAGVLAAVAFVELAAVRAGVRDGRRRPAARLRDRLLALLARLGRRAGPAAVPGDLARRLVAAGSPFGMDAADAMAVRAGAAVAGLAVAVPLGQALPGRLGPVVAVALPAAAFLALDLWLLRRARQRGAAMERELADLLDLLRVAVGAGLPLDRALGEVGRRTTGLLACEWRTFAAQVELGLPREQALALLTERCPSARVAALVRTLERAARHGAPVGEALAAQAREARAAEARRLHERAARAAPKIQLVVALLLVPSVLLLVGAALLTAFVG
jgi:tight adherence protein C